MGENSKIEWTDHTFNPWSGCSKVHAGCAHCYAEVNHFPRRLTNEELAEASGYAIGTGSFNNALGKLRTLEAAEGYTRDGGTKASGVFFE